VFRIENGTDTLLDTAKGANSCTKDSKKIKMLRNMQKRSEKDRFHHLKSPGLLKKETFVALKKANAKVLSLLNMSCYVTP
jgi:hypothetical protein